MRTRLLMLAASLLVVPPILSVSAQTVVARPEEAASAPAESPAEAASDAAAAALAASAALSPPAPPPPSCPALISKAIAADMQAATGKAQHKDLAQQNVELAQAIARWNDAESRCEGPARERVKRNRADDEAQMIQLQEQMAAGSECEEAQRDAGALQTLAQDAFGDRRFSDASLLYRKAENRWEDAVEACTIARKPALDKLRSQAATDAHNAEHCAPRFERAREFSQRLRGRAAALSATDRQQQSQIAETLWREAQANCLDNAQDLALANANAVARERGTPFVPTQPPPEAAPRFAAAPASLPVAAASSASAPGQTQSRVAAAAAPSAAPPGALKSTPPALAVAAVPAATSSLDAIASGAAQPKPGKIAYQNGDLYTGDLVGDRRVGQGEFVWASGQRYKGEWRDDKATGQGELRFVSGMYYEGEVVDGRPQGRGHLHFASGDDYVGLVQDGQPHGHGVYVWANGQRCDCDWVAGIAQGQGELRFANGNVYTGPLKDGLPQGRGHMVFGTKDQYDGDFVQGALEGQGVYRWVNGSRYEGGWQAGHKQGHGHFRWPDGKSFDGEYRNDQPLEPVEAASAPAS
ncbi:MAG: hypothetical protein JO369_06150 [Paucibacter sp.]|nr:hypothetical protein [Roseateles sp.]